MWKEGLKSFEMNLQFERPPYEIFDPFVRNKTHVQLIEIPS